VSPETFEEEEQQTVRSSLDAVLEDMRAVVRDVDVLLHATEGQASEKLADARARVQESLGHAKERLKDTGGNVRDRARSAGQSADTYARENPWTVAAVAVGIGYLLGRVSRRD